MADYNDNDLINKGPDGAESAPQVDRSNELRKYKKWIEKATGDKNRRYNSWAKAGLQAFRGYNDKDGDEEYERAKQASMESADKIFKYDVNYMRQPIEAQIAKTYARNPKFIAKPLKPIFIDMQPSPMVDPMTGMQLLDPMTGQPAMDFHIDPETGMPMQQDISEQICDVVEAVMEVEMAATSFKSEAKACTREAHHSPASVMQIGYQFDEDAEIDAVYFRRRKFEDFIIDCDADIYDGVVRRCRFMGLKWKLSKEEATAMRLDWNAIKSKEAMPGEDYDSKACVWNIWNKESGEVVWISETAQSFAKDPEPWPWKIKGFPFEILKFTEDTDCQFSKPPILAALGIQEELQIQREEITATVTNARPITLYDPAALDETKAMEMTRRGKYSYIPIAGLMGMPQDPFRRVGDHQLGAEYYAHYERNRSELVEILGTSQNEALKTTKATAAESEIVDRNAGNSTSAKIDIQSDFMNACIGKSLQIMKQTYTTERVTQVIGRDQSKYWVRWVGSQILQDIEIKIETGSTEREDSAYNRQVSINMLEVMKGIPGIDVTKLATDVLREHGKRNAEQYQLQMAPQPQMDGEGAGAGATTGSNPAASIGAQVNPTA